MQKLHKLMSKRIDLTQKQFPLLPLIEEILFLFPLELLDFCLEFWVDDAFLDELAALLLGVGPLPLGRVSVDDVVHQHLVFPAPVAVFLLLHLGFGHVDAVGDVRSRRSRGARHAEVKSFVAMKIKSLELFDRFF